MAESIYLQAGDADSTSKGEQHKRGCVGRRAKEADIDIADIDILMETWNDRVSTTAAPAYWEDS